MPQKPWPRRADCAAAEIDVDVVPVIERVEDRVGARGVGGAQVAERLVGEHDAPAERVVRAVALDDGDLVRRVAASSSTGRSTDPAGPPPIQTMRMPAPYFELYFNLGLDSLGVK